MKTKLCDDCRATGTVVGVACPLCKGSGHVMPCDDCEADGCDVCGGTEWCPGDEDDEYSVRCHACEGMKEQLCSACLGGGVVLVDGQPLPRLAAKRKPDQV